MTKRQWAILQVALLNQSREPGRGWDNVDGQDPVPAEVDALVRLLDPHGRFDREPAPAHPAAAVLVQVIDKGGTAMWEVPAENVRDSKRYEVDGPLSMGAAKTMLLLGATRSDVSPDEAVLILNDEGKDHADDWADFQEQRADAGL